jgi:hypothetical protein
MSGGLAKGFSRQSMGILKSNRDKEEGFGGHGQLARHS